MIEFPISTGLLVSRLKAGLAISANPVASNVGVFGSLPAESKRSARMVTFRDDSGPRDGVRALRRYGVNVWAESSVSAEKLANLAMSILAESADADVPALTQFSGPSEVPDEKPLIVSGASLSQFFFTFRATVRAV